MKNKLTKKEIELMEEVKNEWLTRFNSLEFDEKMAKKNINFIYKLAKFNKKPIIIILDSPLACQYGANLMSQVESQVMSQVEPQVGSQVMSQVRSQVEPQVMSQVMSQVRSQVESQVGSQKMTYYYFFYYGDISDYGWVSYIDFFERIGIIKNKNFSKYKKLIKSNIFCIVGTDNGFCFISRPPIELYRNEKGFMHNIKGFAIRFKDGYGLNYVNGVYFDYELFIRAFVKKELSGKDILNLRNTEQKAELIKFYGMNFIINDLKNIKVLDIFKKKSMITNKETECKVFEFEIEKNVFVRYLEVEDHSTHKKTFLGVPREKETETVIGALSWTFNIEPLLYKSIVET
jgi:hypothetical protein